MFQCQSGVLYKDNKLKPHPPSQTHSNIEDERCLQVVMVGLQSLHDRHGYSDRKTQVTSRTYKTVHVTTHMVGW